MKIISTLLLCFIFLTNYSQDTISFKDDFDDNRNNWSIKNNDSQVLEIKDGKYRYENKGTGGLWTYKNIFIDPTKDFSVETTLTQTSGDDNSGFGLVIGLDNGDNYCVFHITSTKFFKIYDYQDTKNSELKAWTKLDIIKPMNEPNKLMIKKIGGTINFSISDAEKCKLIDSTTIPIIRNNLGGHYNHSLFWTLLKANSEAKENLPSGKLADAIIKEFKSFEEFKKQFSEKAVKIFGSGWCWLIEQDGKLLITTTPNQDNPLMQVAEQKGKIVLALDVWEHAYYLKHQNKRIDYISSWWNIVNWEMANSYYEND